MNHASRTPRRIDPRILAPVVFGFFIFGFSDIVGFASSYVQREFSLSEATIGFLPTMVFLWFLVLALPTALVMNRIGRKATALGGYGISIVGLLLPVIPGVAGYAAVYFAAFALIGIGNVVMQVAINPLLATIVPSERMTSYLTVGQIARNVSLMLASPLASLFSLHLGSWRAIFPVYAGVTLLALVWLWATRIDEPRSAPGPRVGFREAVGLMGDRTVLIAFLGIAFFIAVDIGVGVLSPKLLMQRTGLETERATLVSSVYYTCRLVGTVLGVWILARLSDVRYLRGNMLVMAVALIALLFVRSAGAIFALMGVWGYTISCVFATFYAAATRARPDRANEISGLMILAIASGALIGPLMSGGVALAGGSQTGALIVIAPCVGYLVLGSFLLKAR